MPMANEAGVKMSRWREEDYMMMALEEADLAESKGEVPVGAVVVMEGAVVARDHNRTISACDPTAHAEILALRNAAAFTGNHRLSGADLYVTLEPCIMCAGAILHARISRLFYATPDWRFGATGSALNLLDSPFLNHRTKVVSGIKQQQAREKLERFFLRRRGHPNDRGAG